ncbi:MAG: hypothetical protein Q7P63_17265 [Verrucomicrobiota bacterium JB022]|nr:hypothetical protein [Verrucomicrobiota bacterium JB022]
MKGFFSGWKQLIKFLCRYQIAYGGPSRLLKSPYFHIALLLTWLSQSIWAKPGWWAIILETHPAILGFSVAGLGFVLSFGTNGHKFVNILCATSEANHKKESLRSPLGIAGGVFIHFIFMQFLALLLAIAAKTAYQLPAPDSARFLGDERFIKAFWLFCGLLGTYSLTLVIAVSEILFTLLRLSIIFHKKEAQRERLQQRSSNRNLDS